MIPREYHKYTYVYKMGGGGPTPLREMKICDSPRGHRVKIPSRNGSIFGGYFPTTPRRGGWAGGSKWGGFVAFTVAWRVKRARRHGDNENIFEIRPGELEKRALFRLFRHRKWGGSWGDRPYMEGADAPPRGLLGVGGYFRGGYR